MFRRSMPPVLQRELPRLHVVELAREDDAFDICKPAPRNKDR